MIPSEEELMLLLGRVIYETQQTEEAAHRSLTFILEMPFATSIEKLNEVYAKKTLGQFQSIAREKLGLSVSFDEFLKTYVFDRNFIVHNISRTSMFSIYKDEGRQTLFNFLTDFRYRNRKVKMTFMALLEAWFNIACPDRKINEKLGGFRDTPMFKEIEKDFIPKLSSIFGKQLK